MTQFPLNNQIPGISSTSNTIEAQLVWGNYQQVVYNGGILDKDNARDIGHTSQTAQLRPGLILAQSSSTGKVVQWNPYGTNNTNRISGFLMAQTDLTFDIDKYATPMFVGGNIKASEILVPGETDKGLSGNQYEWMIREQLKNRFFFDDDIYGEYTSDSKTVELGTAVALTLTAQDHNTTVTNVGGSATATVTLPAPLPGLKYSFIQKVGQILTVDSTATNQFADGTVTAANDASIVATNFTTMTVEGFRSATTPTYQYMVSRYTT